MTEFNASIISTFITKQTRNYCTRHSKNNIYSSFYNFADPKLNSDSSECLNDKRNLTHVEELDVESNVGACARIQICKYVDVIQEIADEQTVNPNLIATALEGFIGTIFDMIEKYYGDIVTIEADSIVAVWRSRSGSSGSASAIDKNLEYCLEPCVAAIAACAAIKDLFTTQLLQLLAQERGISIDDRIYLKCTIAMGTIYDCNIGSYASRMYNFIMGTAYDNSHICHNSLNTISHAVCIEQNTWSRFESQFSKFGIAARQNEDSSVILSETTKILASTINKIHDFILYSEIPAETAYRINALKPFLHEGHSLFYQDALNSDIPPYVTRGKWSKSTILTGFINTARPPPDCSIAVSSFCSEVFRYVQIIVKCCLTTKKTFLKSIQILQGGLIKFVCLADTAISPVKDAEIGIGRMVLKLRSILELGSTMETRFTFLISSSLSYQGMLMTKFRSFYRVITSSRVLSEDVAIKDALSPMLEDCHEKPWGNIFANEGVFNSCSNSYLSGYFEPVPDSALYYVCRWQDVCRWKRVTSELNGIKPAIDILKKIIKKTSTVQKLIVKGIEGSGNSYFVEKSMQELKKTGYTIFIADGSQNSAYTHPLQPLATLLRQMLLYLDVIAPLKAIEEANTSNSITNASNNSLNELDGSNRSRIDHQLNNPDRPKVKGTSSFFEKFLKNRKDAKVYPENSSAASIPNASARETKDLKSDMKSLDFISRLMERINENPQEIIPLISPLIEPDPPDTPYIKSLSIGGRTYALSRLFGRLIELISTVGPTCLIIDSAHWLDSASWAILKYMLKKCKNILVLITYIPVEDWTKRAMDDILRMENSETVELHGWSKRETENYLLDAFFTYCRRIDKEIIELVIRQTQGHAEHIKRMTQHLKNSEVLHSVDGVLGLHANYKNAEVSCSLETLVKWEFTQLRPEFRELVRLASCVGTVFSLEEIYAIQHGSFSLNALSKGNAAFQIKCLLDIFLVHDIFDWFEYLNHGNHKRDHSSPMMHQFKFKSRLVDETVYGFVKESARISHHRALIRFYEENITDLTETWFIPKICRNYSKLPNMSRNATLMYIKYLNMLAIYLCVVAESFVEARDLFLEMNDLVDKNNLREEIGTRITSEWHVRLSHSYYKTMNRENSPKDVFYHIIAAFKELQFKFPQKEAEWRNYMYFEGVKWLSRCFLSRILFKNYSNPKNTKRIFRWQEYKKNMELDRNERLHPLLQYMSRFLFDTEGRIRDQIVYDLLCSNIAAQAGIMQDSTRKRIFCSFALRFWFGGYKKLAMNLVKTIPEFLEPSETNETDPQTIVMHTRFLLASGHWEGALDLSNHGMKLCERNGEILVFQVCGLQKIFVLIFRGLFNEAKATIETLISEAYLSDLPNHVSAVTAMGYVIEILLGNYEKVASERLKMQHHYADSDIFVQAIYEGIYAMIDIYEGNFDSALESVLKMTEFYTKIHYSTTPIFYNTLLAILVLYHVLESIGTFSTTLESTAIAHKKEKGKKSWLGARVKSITTSARRDISVVQRFLRSEDVDHRAFQTDDLEDALDSRGNLNITRGSLEALPYNLRVKKLSNLIAKGLVAFAGHSLYEPFELMLYGINSSADYGFSAEVARAYSSWIQKNMDNEDSRLLVLIITTKYCRMGTQPEDTRVESELSQSLRNSIGVPDKVRMMNGEELEIF